MGIVNGLCDMFLISCFLLPIFAFRALGAADVKLFFVFAMMAGFKDALIVICGSIVIGAVAALTKMLYFHNFKKRFSYLFSYLQESLRQGHFTPYHQSGYSSDSIIHFTIPIFLSTIIYVIGGTRWITF